MRASWWLVGRSFVYSLARSLAKRKVAATVAVWYGRIKWSKTLLPSLFFGMCTRERERCLRGGSETASKRRKSFWFSKRIIANDNLYEWFMVLLKCFSTIFSLSLSLFRLLSVYTHIITHTQSEEERERPHLEVEWEGKKGKEECLLLYTLYVYMRKWIKIFYLCWRWNFPHSK